MRLDLDLLETFLIVAQERHYGRAAEVRHVAPSTLSKHVQRLERQLDVQLIERDASGVIGLTGAGERLAAHAGSLLDRERALRRTVRGEASTVVLGLPSDGEGGRTFEGLNVVGQHFRQRHPGVPLVRRMTPLPLVTSWLLDHQVDVQVTAGAVSKRSVCSTPLGSVARVAAVPQRGPLGGASEVHVADFLELPMLYDPDVPVDFMEPFVLGDIRPRRQAHLVSIVARDSRTVMEQVVRATGATVLLDFQRSRVPDGVRVLTLVGAAPLVLHAATRVEDHRAPVRSLVELLQAVFSANGH